MKGAVTAVEIQKIKRSVSVGRRFRAALLVLLALMMVASVAAAENGTCSLLLNYSANGAALSGAQFRLYRVAQRRADGGFAFVGAFEKYGSMMNDLNDEKWDAAAATLAGYAAADAIAPDREGAVAEDGALRFDALKEGLYLLTGDVLRVGEKHYTPDPALIVLPGRDAAGGAMNDVNVQPKYAVGENGWKNLTVTKIWTGDSAGSRPAQITVKLLCNGAEVENVVLSADNSWRHTWTNLAGDKLWQVVESPVPDGYTVRIDYEGANATITNARSGGHTDNPPGTDTPGNSNSTLPQTGLVWWPAPVLALSGMTLFLLGWICQKREER